jgi:hypothetical protein
MEEALSREEEGKLGVKGNGRKKIHAQKGAERKREREGKVF